MTVHQFGQADATRGQQAASLNLYNAYRAKKGLCQLHDSVMREFEADNLQRSMYAYCAFLSSTPIPAYPRPETPFEPRNPENPRYMVVSTLKKYVGQAKEHIRRLHKEHPDFANLRKNEHPPWFTVLMSKFEDAVVRYHMRLKGQEDVIFGDKNVQPLYRNNFLSAGNSVGNSVGPSVW